MENYDVIVVGSGSGMIIANAAINEGMKVALVEMGKLGGTCLNTGCIPTKMIIYPADIINQIKHAKALGIKANIEKIDFAGIMKRTREFVEHDRRPMEEAVKKIPGLVFYPVKGEFTSDYTLKVGEEIIKGKYIFVVSGARPYIPPIKGIEEIEYFTNQNVWNMIEAPNSMIIVGGGLIAVEMAHFFNSMGVKVIVLSRSPRLIKRGEPEISEILLSNMQRRMRVELGVEVIQVEKNGTRIEVTTEMRDGKKGKFTADTLFLATGRKSNADLLRVEKTGVEVDNKGFIKVNANYETQKKGIYAFGDAIGREMYKHIANKEAEIVWHGFKAGHFHPLDYDKTPYAVFSWPQIASVGLTEREAKKRGHKILVGEYKYADTAKGAAMAENDGYIKVIVEDEKKKILGAHIIGPFAPILIQEIVNMMYTKEGLVYPLMEAIHIHPSLTEVVQRAFFNLRYPDHSHH